MTSRAVVIVKTGRFPLAYGTLGAVRSARQLGFRTYAFADSVHVPYALSRALSAPITVAADERTLLRLSLAVGRAVLLAASDGAAVLLANHQRVLRDRFVLPDVPAHLPAMVADKALLAEVALSAGIPTPRTIAMQKPSDVERFLASARFPVVVKTGRMWLNADALQVVPTTIVDRAEDLRRLVVGREADVVVQEYLPAQGAQDWIANAYVDGCGTVLFCGTARKYRSWLPGTGVACMARAEPNPQVAELTRVLLAGVGYRGLVDVDFRFDPRDHTYKLLDFNPRMGAAAAVFRADSGLDLLQIALLDLVGESPGPQNQAYGQRLVVENLDLPARLFYRSMVPRHPGERIRLSWWDRSDPLPFAAMLPWQAAQWSRQVVKQVRALPGRR